MNTNIKLKTFSFFVLLIFTLSMLFPKIALADETTPPPDETQEPAPPAEETEEPLPPVQETDEPLLPPAETQEPVLATEDPSVTEAPVEGALTGAVTEEATPVPTGAPTKGLIPFPTSQSAVDEQAGEEANTGRTGCHYPRANARRNEPGCARSKR